MLVPADVGFFVFNQLAAPVEVIGKAAVELKLKKSAAKLICNTGHIMDMDSVERSVQRSGGSTELLFQNFRSQADPETLASTGRGNHEGISPDMVKTDSSMVSSMPPDELPRMLEMATSFQRNNNPLNNSNRGSGIPNVTPDMLKTCIPNVTPDMLKTSTDMMNKMPPEELQNMLNMESSFKEQG
ncbi:hypothetical protein Tco_0456699 [Tanacetum coccineum]